MLKANVPLQAVAGLEEEHAKALQMAEEFYSTLTRLRYEGKAALGKNVSDARKALAFFQSDLICHFEVEESILFPYAETHIPKLEPFTSLFRSEHEDFRKNLFAFQAMLGDLLSDKKHAQDGLLQGKLQNTGLYLIYLLRNHIQGESTSLYRAIRQELRQSEKKELALKMKTCQRELAGRVLLHYDRHRHAPF